MASLVFSPFTLSSSKAEHLSSLSNSNKHSFLRKKNHRSTKPPKSFFTVKSAVSGNGLFTQTNPEVRRIVPIKRDNVPTVKIVYVVLEAQYQSSLTEAVQSLNKTSKFASYEVVGYLVEELRDKNTYNSFCKDLVLVVLLGGSHLYNIIILYYNVFAHILSADTREEKKN